MKPQVKQIHGYALELYDALHEQGSDEGEDGRVFRGSITKAFQTLGISNGYYTSTQRLLASLGAIETVQRGARGIETVIQLHDRPTLEELAAVTLTKPTSAATLALDQRLSDIEKRIGRLDIVKALAELEARIATIEKESLSGT